MDRIFEWLTDALFPIPQEEAPAKAPQSGPDYPEPPDPVLALVEITRSYDWDVSPDRMVLRRDRKVWFYLDHSAWRQGGTRELVSSQACQRLWDLHGTVTGEQASSARKAVLDSLRHFRILRED